MDRKGRIYCSASGDAYCSAALLSMHGSRFLLGFGAEVVAPEIRPFQFIAV
jgi:hypothetical protein